MLEPDEWRCRCAECMELREEFQAAGIPQTVDGIVAVINTPLPDEQPQ